MESANLILSFFNIFAFIFGTVIIFPSPDKEVHALTKITHYACVSFPYICTFGQQISVWSSFMGAVFKLGSVMNPKAYKLIKSKRVLPWSILIVVLIWVKFPKIFKELVIISSYYVATNQTMINKNCTNKSNLLFFSKNSPLTIFPIAGSSLLQVVVSVILTHKLLVAGNLNRRFSYLILFFNISNLVIKSGVILVLVMHVILRPNHVYPFEINAYGIFGY